MAGEAVVPTGGRMQKHRLGFDSYQCNPRFSDSSSIS